MDLKIAHSIKKARLKSGLTQKDVEQALGLRPLQIKDYETGRIKFPAEMAIKLSDYYKVSLEELLRSQDQSTCLSQLESLFDQRYLKMMQQDPVIRSYVDTHIEQAYKKSFFEIITSELTDSELKEFQQYFLCFLNTTIGVDYKILDVELIFVNNISAYFGEKIKKRKYDEYLTKEFQPEKFLAAFRKFPHLGHFVLWTLFLLAISDDELNNEEIKYIEKVAQYLKIARVYYLEIRDHFVKEDF